MALLSLTDVTKRYGALVVTDGISLEVADGEIVGILGPNGAGKTTLFNLVAGTVRPDAGKVTFRATTSRASAYPSAAGAGSRAPSRSRTPFPA